MPHGITNVGANQKTVHVTKDNFPDTGTYLLVDCVVIKFVLVVWNPWADKAAGMSDFGNDEVTLLLVCSDNYCSCSITIWCVWRLDMCPSQLFFQLGNPSKHLRC